MNKTVLLSAGGTGGHLFPAQSLAQELGERGWTVHLATDKRAERFSGAFPAKAIHIIDSATISGKSPVMVAKAIYTLAVGYFRSRSLISKIKPDVAVGFGGYPTVPPLLAAAHKAVPTVLHEQNAIMGRANRFLAGRVSAIAVGFEQQKGASVGSAPVTLTGNPLRDLAHEAAQTPFRVPSADGPFHLLIFGGSQGARFFSQITPKALSLLTNDQKKRMRLTIQARPEDAENLRSELSEIGVEAHIETFFDNLPGHIASSQLVMCRSGASSVAELALIGRPSILVPLPGSLDDDQGANAKGLADAGGAVLVRQRELSAEKLAQLLRSRYRS